ncbi:MAG: hypothetical protein LKF52_04790 [Butyrivibrio sp.]|jgi:hypothetical protein|nr:hypothetical protein [Butyrivibrio sp.]
MSKMKKVLPVLLMIWPYLPLILLFTDSYRILMDVYLGFTGPVYILNIVNVFTCRSADPAKETAHCGMLLKLLQIPFYLLFFIIWIQLFASKVISMSSSAPQFLFDMTSVVDILLMIIASRYGVDVEALLGMLTGIYALLMITSSMYGVSAAVKGVRSGQISRRKAVLLSVMHFIFALDVIGAVMMHASMKKSVPEVVQQNA